MPCLDPIIPPECIRRRILPPRPLPITAFPETVIFRASRTHPGKRSGIQQDTSPGQAMSASVQPATHGMRRDFHDIGEGKEIIYIFTPTEPGAGLDPIDLCTTDDIFEWRGRTLRALGQSVPGGPHYRTTCEMVS